MITLASIALTLTIGLVTLAYGQVSQNRAGFLLYNNTDYGFQILYPQDWTVLEGDIMAGDYYTNWR